jgi:hypothetical protein
LFLIKCKFPAGSLGEGAPRLHHQPGVKTAVALRTMKLAARDNNHEIYHHPDSGAWVSGSGIRIRIQEAQDGLRKRKKRSFMFI